MLAAFRARQRAAFERITADGDERERLDLARLLLECVDSVAGLRGRAVEDPR